MFGECSVTFSVGYRRRKQVSRIHSDRWCNMDALFHSIKWAGMQQKHSVSPKSKKFTVCHSAGKVMTTVFRDVGVISAEFVVQATNQCEHVLWQLHESICMERCGHLLQCVVLRRDIATPHGTHWTHEWCIHFTGKFYTIHPIDLTLDHWRNTWEVASCTIMRKQKLLFMSGCECNSLMSLVIEFFNAFQDRKNVSMCSGIMLKNNGTWME